MNIQSLLKTKETILKSNLDILLSHPVTKGEHCEAAWIDFFRSFLAGRYKVDKGFVFDSKGGVSEQIDIIIYDALYTPLIFGTEAGEKFITAESVYAVFDSKPSINKKTLEYTNKKIKSITSLYRTSRGYMNGNQEQKPKEPPKILGGILAIEGIGINRVQKHLEEYEDINLGCAIKDYSFVKRNSDGKFIKKTNEEIILSFFYMILDELHKMGTVPAIDIREYAKTTIDLF
ncbi:DUF6602 domain-containing protein [Cellulosilyticum ruminicola]|uniref:DUF6602 domain-containing protein n=1 Tax=Cellulosilyticum ruminicola TaxID=425254 RepID=UPI0006D11C09|nr:DUF6602 domain-containing protein [Cellulosilyticum ruminicola]